MKVKLKRDLLWWSTGTVLTDKEEPTHNLQKYIDEGHADLVEEEEKEKSDVEKKLEDIKEDLEDDGKRNYSHDPKRKSPGRKPKKRLWGKKK